MEDSGSGHLDFNQTVGMVTNPQQCTGGFTVRTIATPRDYGLLTAGHCKSNNTQFGYQEAGGGITTATLTYQNEKFDADSDLAWVLAGSSASDVDNRFYANAWRVLFGVITKTGTLVGDDMCKYGRVTGHTCGVVASTAYNPGSICGPGVTFGSGTGGGGTSQDENRGMFVP